MGYYTHYTLNVDSEDTSLKDKIRKRLQDVSGEEFVINSDLNLEIEDDVQWYEYEDDVRIISKEFPELVFTLRGAGEETGDLWIKYFKNGKVQEAKTYITYDDFDEAKLK